MHRRNSSKRNLWGWDWLLLLFIVLIAMLGTGLGMKLMVTFGFTPYPAIIGVMLAVALSRLPIPRFQLFSSTHRQNLMQTAITCATFGAANCLLVPMGIPFLMGRQDLVLPMLIGASLAMILDAVVLSRLFGTILYPKTESWPLGVATAETMKRTEHSGKQTKLLQVGIMISLIGSFLQIPLSAIGIAFLSDSFAIVMLGMGVILRVHSTDIFQIDLNTLLIPHGIMIGAGLVVLWQTGKTLMSRSEMLSTPTTESKTDTTHQLKYIRHSLLFSGMAYGLIAVLVAGLSGWLSSMSMPMFISFVLFAIIANSVQQLIVGKTSMKTGFFPAFSLAFIYLLIGLLLGFPHEALGLLVGLAAATGPVFAGMGYSLKAGSLLRGDNKDPEQEKKGRNEQLVVGLLALIVATVGVGLFYEVYFSKQLIPPADFVFLTTMQASLSMEMIQPLVIWGVLGAGLQILTGSGILFATGLLLTHPLLGWMIVLGVILKVYLKRSQRMTSAQMNVLAAGFIAGDMLGSWLRSLWIR